jgi:lipoate-protein ligase A
MIDNNPYVIINNNSNPYFNLALEEYLLKNFTKNIFMLWCNEPCVVIGKNQNTLAEIDVAYVKKHKIKIVRRLSGGGAVFHDLGNLNFTFIVDDKQNAFSNFSKFTMPIIEILAKLGVKAELSGRNDLIISTTGQKFSGNAQYRYGARLLHHGTILFDAALNNLVPALKANPAKLEAKGVKSIASRITNIHSHLPPSLTASFNIRDFSKLIHNHICTNKNYVPYNLTAFDIDNVNTLVAKKYRTWEWNYGDSPDYNLLYENRFKGGSVATYLKINNNLITNARIVGDFFGKYDIKDIEQSLLGTKYDEENVATIISRFKVQDYIAGIDNPDFIQLLFGNIADTAES